MRHSWNWLGAVVFSLVLLGCQDSDLRSDRQRDPASQGKSELPEPTVNVAESQPLAAASPFPPSPPDVGRPYPPSARELVGIQVTSVWNLVSFPVVKVTEIATFLNADIKYNAIRSVWKWDAGANTWRVYPQAGAYPLLTEITPDDGYWVRSTSSFTLSGAGRANLYDFSGGWNLIGYNHSGSAVSVSNFFSSGDFWNGSCGSGATVVNAWAWVNGVWLLYYPDDADRVAFNTVYGTNFGALTTLQPGMGLWVRATRGNSPPSAGGCPSVSGKLPDSGQTTRYGSDTGQDADYTGKQLSYSDNGDGTVTDNNTKLVWQKQDDGQRYSWDAARLGCANLTLGGYYDWRLPTAKELQSLVDYSKPYPGPTINGTYFPNAQSYSYWSSTTNAINTSSAWYVEFGLGGVSDYGKSGTFYVRCVRGGSESVIWSLGNLTSTTDTVTMPGTGLMWQRTPDSTRRTWSAALTYCEALSLGGFSDWRLPNVRELQSIVDYSTYNPAIKTSAFSNTQSDAYWSSTYADITSYAWLVSFIDGSVGSYDKSSAYYVRCVRGGL